MVNLRNGGTLDFLPDQAVIEVPAAIGADGPRSGALAPLSPVMRGLVAAVSAYEELALDAAIRGGRDRVLATCWPTPWSASSTWPAG